MRTDCGRRWLDLRHGLKHAGEDFQWHVFVQATAKRRSRSRLTTSARSACALRRSLECPMAISGRSFAEVVDGTRLATRSGPEIAQLLRPCASTRPGSPHQTAQFLYSRPSTNGGRRRCTEPQRAPLLTDGRHPHWRSLSRVTSRLAPAEWAGDLVVWYRRWRPLRMPGLWGFPLDGPTDHCSQKPRHRLRGHFLQYAPATMPLLYPVYAAISVADEFDAQRCD